MTVQEEVDYIVVELTNQQDRWPWLCQALTGRSFSATSSDVILDVPTMIET